MAAKKRILFICHGNACRSAMAEKIANTLWSEMFCADSAGTHAVLPFVNMDRNTIEVMDEIGIDISRHKPKHVSTINPESFDILVNMSPIPGKKLIENYFPTFKGKVIEWKVVDPRGYGKDIYRSVRDHLAQGIEELARGIKGKEGK